MDLKEQLPQKFLSRLQRIIPAEKLSDTLASFSLKRPTTFRANTLKISPEKLSNHLSLLHIPIVQVSWNKNAFLLLDTPQRVLMETDVYKNGSLYIQSLSSMIPPLVLDPQKHEKILDLTAAPGSKTTQIAALMENTGEILANDKSHVRNFKLKANLLMQGVTNTQVTQLPGQIIWKKLPEFFDRALVDVPCSMEGRITVQDEKTYTDWSVKKIQYLEEVQRYLLRSAISAVKPGGIIVYSTCTLAPEENEGVIDWILKKEGSAIEILDIEIPGLLTTPSLPSWNTKVYDPEIKHTMRILPSEIMEGFFVAKILKKTSTVTNIHRDS